MDVAAVAAIAAKIMQAVAGFAITTLVPMAFKLLMDLARDKRAQSAFIAVTRAGKVGASVVSAAMMKRLEEATKDDSPGGKVVTPEETRAVFDTGRKAALGYLAESVPYLMTTIYKQQGGEEGLNKALDAMFARWMNQPQK